MSTGCLRVKPGVLFTWIAPGGFRILGALDQTALSLGLELTITSACDGEHSGPDDPHHRGEAFDVRVHDLEPEEIQRVLTMVMDDLSLSVHDGPLRSSGGLATQCFFGFLEDPGSDNMHLHFQTRRGVAYP